MTTTLPIIKRRVFGRKIQIKSIKAPSSGYVKTSSAQWNPFIVKFAQPIHPLPKHQIFLRWRTPADSMQAERCLSNSLQTSLVLAMNQGYTSTMLDSMKESFLSRSRKSYPQPMSAMAAPMAKNAIRYLMFSSLCWKSTRGTSGLDWRSWIAAVVIDNNTRFEISGKVMPRRFSIIVAPFSWIAAVCHLTSKIQPRQAFSRQWTTFFLSCIIRMP